MQKAAQDQKVAAAASPLTATLSSAGTEILDKWTKLGKCVTKHDTANNPVMNPGLKVGAVRKVICAGGPVEIEVTMRALPRQS